MRLRYKREAQLTTLLIDKLILRNHLAMNATLRTQLEEKRH